MEWSILHPVRGASDQVIAIDLGTHTTKAVLLQRTPQRLCLRNYVLCATPLYEKALAGDLLSDHLANVVRALGAKGRDAVLVIGMENSLLRCAEMPAVSLADMRRMLKLNGLKILNQNLPDFEVDCHWKGRNVSDRSGMSRKSRSSSSWPKTEWGSSSGATATAPGLHKTKVLVGAARTELVNHFHQAAEQAGLTVQQITLSQTSLVNAVVMALPQVVQEENVALVNVGFSSTTISILVEGEPVLTRVIPFGADKITSGLAEVLNVSYPAAESVKVTMPHKVADKIRAIVTPLTADLRNAIDFFEAQEDCLITKVYLAGGSARSDVLINLLPEELGPCCRRFDPTSFLQLQLPPEQLPDLEREAPQLAEAIGAAANWFNPEWVNINLLAEQQEAVRSRQRDPGRRLLQVCALVLLLLLGWAGVQAFQTRTVQQQRQDYEQKLRAMRAVSLQAASLSKESQRLKQQLSALQQRAASRLLMADLLNALQYTSVADVQVMRVVIQQDTEQVKAVANTKPRPGLPEARQGWSLDTPRLLIQARNFGPPSGLDAFIESLSASPFFKNRLRKINPVMLTERLPEQVDPADPERTFTLFTVECFYPPRLLGYE